MTTIDRHYNGLTSVQPTLPANWYFDAQHHERELQRIWYDNWVYVCHEEALSDKGAYRSVAIGTQNILVVRDGSGALHAFHNTCRHRGSVLCTETEGRFRSGAIVCPYHRWRYSLGGELLRVPSRHCPDGFNKADYPLYEVAVGQWRGLVFVNLAGSRAAPLEASFDPSSANLEHWPLESLKTGHRYRKTMACNWKIFWENFNECLHCPGVHPQLCKMVPIYKRGYMEPQDDPDFGGADQPDRPEFTGGMRAGAMTWTLDGQPVGRSFPDLTENERKTGYHYVVNRPSMFIAAHVDYVRSVRLLPLGPEETELQVEWLFPAATLADENADIQSAIEFTQTVMDEDAMVAELNQRGLRSRSHRHGVLMAEEYDVHDFQNWVRAQLDG